MAVVASERVEYVKYRATHSVAFKELTPLIKLEKDWTSSFFSSPGDPDEVKFQIHLDFEEDTAHRLKLHPEIRFVSGTTNDERRTTNDEMLVHTCKITLADVEPRTAVGCIDNWKISASTLENGCFYNQGPPIVLLVVPETLTIKTEVVYFNEVNVKNTAIPRTDPNLHDDLLRLFTDAESADAKVTISVGEEGRRFLLLKDFLRVRSEYFEAVFATDMTEARTNELTIPDVDPDLFEELLKFIYSGLVPTNLRDVARGLLPLADRFRVTTLKTMCAASIANGLDSTNVIRALLLAVAHSVPDLAEKCVPIIRRNVQALKANEDWQELMNNPDAVALLFE